MIYFLGVCAVVGLWMLWCAIRYLKKLDQHIAELRDERKRNGRW